MVTRLFRSAAVLVTAVLVAACPGDTTSPPAGLNVTGTWSGSVAGGGSSGGTIALVLQQSGATVTGTFNATFTGGVTASASVSGTASQSTFTFSTPQFNDSHGCSAQITSAAMTVTDNSMQGTANVAEFVSTSCGNTTNSTVTPTLTLAKQ